MKTLLLLALTGYQNIVSPLVHQLLGQKTLCRYETNCSSYAKEVIEKYGVLKGSLLSVKRLVSCSAFVKRYANI